MLKFNMFWCKVFGHNFWLERNFVPIPPKEFMLVKVCSNCPVSMYQVCNFREHTETPWRRLFSDEELKMKGLLGLFE